MKQQTLAMAADQSESFERYRRPTRRDEFLATMERIVPWAELCEVVAPHYPKAGNGRPPVGLERMLRMYFVQHWFNLADEACEEALLDSVALRRFVGIDLGRERVPDGSGIARALDYSLNRWQALSRFLRDGEVSCHNNHLENRLRPWAMGRKAWLFAGSELAGQRAAIVMSLVQSARLHGHDPWVYLKDVLERLPMHLNSRIEELLPHRWQAPAER